MCTKEITVFNGSDCKNSFLHKFQSSAPSNEYFLAKYDSNGDLVFADFVSSTYGEVFPVGSIAEYPNYGGCRVDWDKVADNLGFGKYRVCVNAVEDKTVLSYIFNIESDFCSDGYFKIETNANGLFRNFLYNLDETISIEREYDLERMNWYDSNTYKGRIRVLSPEESSSNEVVDGQFLRYPHEKSFEKVYEITLFQVNQELYKRLYLYGLRGDDIKITDYNDDSEYDFINIDVFNAQESSYDLNVGNSDLFSVKITVKGKRKIGFRSC